MNGWSELYPENDAPGSVDLGDEFENPNQPWRRHAQGVKLDLARMTDMLCHIVASSNTLSGPRPAVTAWEGADMDAFYWTGATWLHCQTGAEWEGNAVNLLEAMRERGHA